MISVENIKAGVVKAVKDLIGSHLSTLPTQTGTTPAVILNRTNVPKPSFPYSVVDHILLNQQGYSSRSEYIALNEDEVTQFDYTLSISIQVNGAESDDVVSMVTHLRSLLFSNKGKKVLKSYLEPLDARVLRISGVTFSSTFMSTDFEDVARLTLFLNVADLVVDEDLDFIEDVDVQENITG